MEPQTQRPTTCQWDLDRSWQDAKEPEFQEEPAELHKLRQVRTATPKEVENHEKENHTVYREWCEVCRGARSTGPQHRKTWNKVRKRRKMDHAFLRLLLHEYR